jgi:uncharacterized repeat protein (TIGR03803 family)
LAPFNGNNGANPADGLVLDGEGNLYGTTQFGGAHDFGDGTVFEVAKGSDSITDLLSFNYSNGVSPYESNGAYPSDGVLLDGNGDLYCTASGGANDEGEIVLLTPPTPTTTVTVTSSSSPSVAGQSVTLTAAFLPVASGTTPTGSVIFYDGTTELGAAQLVGPGALDWTLTTSSLTPGTHSITAVYSGDSNFPASASLVFTQIVSQVVSNDLTVKFGGFTFNRSTRQFTQSVTITNHGSEPIVGPIEFELFNLTNASLVNQTGAAPTQASPYTVVLTTGSLAAGQSLTFTLVFVDPTLAAIAYSSEFLAEPIPSED